MKAELIVQLKNIYDIVKEDFPDLKDRIEEAIEEVIDEMTDFEEEDE